MGPLGYALSVIHIHFLCSIQSAYTHPQLSSSFTLQSLMLSKEQTETEVISPIIQNYTNGPIDFIKIEQYISQFFDLYQLNTLITEQSGNERVNNNNLPSSIRRQLVCQNLLKQSLSNDSKRREEFLKLINSKYFQLNDSASQQNEITELIVNLCIHESNQYFQQYYYTQWSNSTERYLLKIILKDTIIPVIYFLNTFSMICLNCPIYCILSRKNPQVSVWFLLAAYSILKTIHIFIFHLPKLIINLFTLYSNYLVDQTHYNYTKDNISVDIQKSIMRNYSGHGSDGSITEGISNKLQNFHGLQNLGLIPCSMFTFLETVLQHTPNWIIVVLVWEQIARFIVQQSALSNNLHRHHHHCPLDNNHVDRKYQMKSHSCLASPLLHRSKDFMFQEGEDKYKQIDIDQVVEEKLTITLQQQRQQYGDSYSQSITYDNQSKCNYLCDAKSSSNFNRSLKEAIYSSNNHQIYTNMNADSVIDGGLTLFGAKLITITIIVLEIFLNVHSLWLHNYSNGKCGIDLEGHSPIFTHIYPYLLRVIQCSIPNLGCFIGVIVYIIYSLIQFKRKELENEATTPTTKYDAIDLKPIRNWNASNEDNFEGVIINPLACNSSVNLSANSTQSRYKKFVQHGIFRQLKIKNCSILLSCTLSPQTCSTHPDYVKPIISIQSKDNPDHSDNSYNQLQDNQQKRHKMLQRSVSDWDKKSTCSIFISLDTGKYLGLTLAIYQVIFNVPTDILWYYTEHLQPRFTSDNVARFYEVVKFRQLFNYSIHCWSSLQLCFLFWITFLLSSIVRHQCKHLFCNRKQFYCTQSYFTCCFCGYNCL